MNNDIDYIKPHQRIPRARPPMTRWWFPVALLVVYMIAEAITRAGASPLVRFVVEKTCGV